MPSKVKKNKDIAVPLSFNFTFGLNGFGGRKRAKQDPQIKRKYRGLFHPIQFYFWIELTLKVTPVQEPDPSLKKFPSSIQSKCKIEWQNGP